MRILHLIDGVRAGAPGRDEGLTVAACAGVMRHAPGEHAAITIGGSELARQARRGGVPGWDVLAPPLGKPLLATRALRRVLLDHRPDVVQAWSLTALAAARRAGPEFRRSVCIADGAAPVTPGVRALHSAACGVVGTSMRQDLVAAGAAGGTINIMPWRGVAEMPARDEARAALGLARDEVAVAQLGADPYAGAMRFVFTVALLAEAGCRMTAIVSNQASNLARGLSFYSNTARLFRLVVARDPAAALAAADVALYEGGGLGPMHCLPPRAGAAAPHIARALSVGVPVVAPAWALADLALPSDLREGCLALNALPTELARVALPLAQDDRVRARLSEAARLWAARACDDGRFAQAVARLWER